ncbi:YlbL family protein [Actinoplanes friuliensis]|jgi:Lon-like protease|uniref:PDZ domain-containing protein n=1 Tax=Actinoplanes friuliensis DSM 7358 TaxID=1246995 RepID=U5WD88_9ACTN|nr:PDZ domain-containing protein [Actinoplanes friuliensis]AGZ45916.1 PDZ domain-containing protein [Actinoplanes friuliensis DSM 7358]
MRRRGVTVILGALITALLAVGVMAFPLPYVVLKPGPTVNTLGSDNGKEVIQVTKADTSTSQGQLRLTTVGVQPSVELVWAIRGWFSDEQAVVPRELIYPPDRSEQQVEEQNAEEFKSSQYSAVTVALRELGYPVQTFVTEVTAGGASVGQLQKDDVITSVDGVEVTSPGQLTQLIQAKPAGTALTVGYTRAGKPATAKITTRSDSKSATPRIGVGIDKKQPHPFTVEIDLDEIGGPSAGLMFTLGIIDKLKPEDLTGGKIIAGTGTIDDEGNVGPIGGIPQKLVGAKDAGAQLFLVPADNCAEAMKNAVSGLPMAEVATADDALTALKTFTSGGTPKPCPAA